MYLRKQLLFLIINFGIIFYRFKNIKSQKSIVMKNLIIFSFLIVNISAFSQFNRDPFRDSDEGNFYLRSGKVFFQKTYNSSVNFNSLEEKLTSYNSPNGGFQIKKTNAKEMNGVLINYHLNWNYKEMKTRKIADFLKNPVNATFEITKNAGAYQVVVNNIWFMDVKQPKNKSHNTLESIVTGKNGYVFTKNKKTLEALDMIDENFQWIFQMQGNTKDIRF